LHGVGLTAAHWSSCQLHQMPE